MEPSSYKKIIVSLAEEFSKILKDHCYSDYYVISDEDKTTGQIFTLETYFQESYIGHGNKLIEEVDFIRPVLQFQSRGPWKNECLDINKFFRINDEVINEFWELGERGELDSLIPIFKEAKKIILAPKHMGQSEIEIYFSISISGSIFGGTQFLREILEEDILYIALNDMDRIEVGCNQRERKTIIAFLDNKPIKLRIPFDKIPKIEVLRTEYEGPNIDPSYIFVIMSFQDDPFLEDVYLAIKRAVSGVRKGLRCERVDDIQEDFIITDKVIDCIMRATIIVADITGSRPNVYYEIGYARGQGKTIILTAKEGEKPHFDISTINIIFYKNATELERRLKSRLRSMFKKL